MKDNVKANERQVERNNKRKMKMFLIKTKM